MRWFSTESYRAGPYTGVDDLEAVGMGTVASCATTIPQIISELRVTTIAERSGRAQDEGRGMETLRKLGHM